MGYRNYSRKYRKKYRKRSYRRSYRPKISTRGLAMKSFKMARRLKRKVKAIEVKTIDTFLTATQFGFSGAVGLINSSQLCTVAQGTDVNDRIGTKTNLLSISLRCTFETATLATDTTLARCIGIRWKSMTGGASPALASVLEDVTSAAAALNSPFITNNSLYAIKYKYKILWDDRFSWGSWNPTNAKKFKVYSKKFVGNQGRMGYIGVGDTVADVNEGNIHVYFFSSETAVATAPTVSYYSRVRYIDP